MKNTTIQTKHFDITLLQCVFKILMNDGRYLYYEFNNKHKIKEKDIWMLK